MRSIFLNEMETYWANCNLFRSSSEEKGPSLFPVLLWEWEGWAMAAELAWHLRPPSLALPSWERLCPLFKNLTLPGCIHVEYSCDLALF